MPRYNPSASMRRIIALLQDRAAAVLGLEPQRRTPLVRAMLFRPRGDAAGYWLQLLIATALATLGLALDSTAVVIGAMLIAPLMRPIVELAMGLATGSTPLVFRTGLRAVTSIAIVVMASAAFSWSLPFHEVTTELLARTAPTMLDLFVAAACALAGAYAVVIAGNNDVATTAAGTSIGISLVPPLCTAGYGLSIGDWDMAIGAGLLFTANVTGIVTVAGAVFVIIGFGQVNIREEEAALDSDANVGAATRFGRAMSLKDARLNIIPRVLLPVLLLGSIAYPLMRAVDAMSHRSDVRQRIAALMESSSGERIVQYSMDQTARPMSLRVVVVGDPATARAMEERLRRVLRELREPEARVAVWAVPDATSVAALSARLDDVPVGLPAPEPEPPPPPPPLSKRVTDAWPARTAGPLLSVWTMEGPPPRVRLAHLGPEIGAAGRALLTDAVTAGGTAPQIEEIAIDAIESDERGVVEWLPRALALLSRAAEFPSVHFCVTAPPPPAKRVRVDPAVEAARKLLEQQLSAVPAVSIQQGDRWRIAPQLEACPTAEPPPASP